jgi:hypothetical protein
MTCSPNSSSNTWNVVEKLIEFEARRRAYTDQRWSIVLDEKLLTEKKQKISQLASHLPVNLSQPLRRIAARQQVIALHSQLGIAHRSGICPRLSGFLPARMAKTRLGGWEDPGCLERDGFVPAGFEGPGIPARDRIVSRGQGKARIWLPFWTWGIRS